MKNSRYLMFLGIMLFALNAPGARANETGLISVPPMAAPVMDGEVSSAAEWRSAAQIAGWTDPVLGVANGDGSLISVGHAAGVLYVRFVCPVPEKFRLNKVIYASFALKMTAKEKDGNIFQDDYVGVYLTPPDSKDLYFLGINGAGAARDTRNGDGAWNGRWRHQQSLDDFFWTVELEIPLDQFGGASAENQTWGTNFAHGSRNIELLESLWTYQPAVLNPMAAMRLSDRPVAVVLSAINPAAEGSLSLRGSVVNLSKDRFEGLAEFTVRGTAGTERPVVFGPDKTALSLKPGEKKDLAVNCDLPGPMCARIEVLLRDTRGAALLDYALPFVFAQESSLETRWIPTPAILQVVLDLGTPAGLKKITGARVEISSLDTGEQVMARSLPALDKVISISNLKCPELPPGRYQAAVDLNIGSATTRLKSTFQVEPKPEWLGNSVGITDKVPVPWTPVKLERTRPLSLSCWGRQYTFGPAGFPAQINVLGKDILAGPVRVTIKRGGKTERVPEGVARVTDKKDVRVAFSTEAEAAGVKVSADTWMEFDGFLWNTVTVQPQSGAPIEIEALSIEVPLRKEYATLWWEPLLSTGVLTDKMGAPPDRPYACEPTNFLRLGDEEHGIQFCYESLRNWHPAPGKGQELIPGEKEYVLRYNVIGQLTKLDTPIEFALGYMALPCRPRSDLFRRINANGMWAGGWPNREYIEKHNWLFQTYTYGSGNFGRYDCNYFNLWNREVYDEGLLSKYKEKSILPMWEKDRNTLCLYYQACLNDANTPEYRTYRFEWKAIPGNAPYVPPDPKTRDKVIFGSVCQQSRSYCDFQLWYMNKLLRYLSDDGKIPVHGYQDIGGHALCMNDLHGCPVDGHFPVRGNREWAKRVYTMYKTINPLNQLYIHTGGQSAMNWCGFFDVMIEGEQFTANYLGARVNDPSLPKDYTRLFNLERYRAQCQPYAWGPDRFYLNQFYSWQEEEPFEGGGAMGHLWGLSLCHDCPVWGGFPTLSIVRAITELGWDDQTEFIPYWRKQAGLKVETDAAPVVVSAWRRGPGNLLAMVFNDSDQTAKGQLSIDFSRFGFQAGPVKCRDYGAAGLAYPDAPFSWARSTKQFTDPQSLRTQDTVTRTDGAIPVDIGRRSFRLLRFHQ